MTLSLRFHPAVRDEIDEGGEFLDEVQGVFDEITANPARFGYADGDIR